MSNNNQTTNKTNNNEEEVDLGSLFVIIGKGFSNFFNFIGNIFKGIFRLIISILIFLKTNIVKIGIAALIGGVLGVFLEAKQYLSVLPNRCNNLHYNAIALCFENLGLTTIQPRKYLLFSLLERLLKPHL